MFRRFKRSNLKHGNQRSLCALNHSHRSKLESSVCQMLQLREKSGEIQLVQIECHVVLTEAQIKYVSDFKCIDLATGRAFYVEAKGFESPRWPIIKKLWHHYGPAKLEIWKGTYTNPKLDEIVIPKGET
jgi:hypothetical protein